MNDKKLLMWLFILLLLACVAGYFYVKREATGSQTLANYHRPVKDNGPRFAQGERPDFTSMLDEKEGRPEAGWGQRTSRYAPSEPKLVSTPASGIINDVSNRSSAAQNRATLQAEQSAHMGTPTQTYSNSTGYNLPRGYTYTGPNASSSMSDTYNSDTAGGDLLATYTPKQTRAEQKALDQKLKNLSSGLNNAIMKVLAPKSQREQNIEKYLPKEQQQAHAAQVAQSVEEEITKQADGIVSSIGKAYGKGAAQKAASIMNDFKKEMSDTLSKPGDALEKQIAARKVNNKYNEKLEKLSNEEALKKLREQLAAENEAYLKRVEGVYGTQLADALRPTMENYANQRLKLYATPMSDIKFVQEEAALREKLSKEQEEIFKKQAVGGTGNLTALQNDEVRERIKTFAQAVKEGKAISSTYIADLNAVREEGDTMKENMVARLEAAGPEVQAQVGNIFDKLAKDLVDLSEQASGQLTQAEYESKKLDLIDAANEAAVNVQVNNNAKTANAKYEEYYKDMPEELKSQARPIWQKYNQQRAELGRTPMNDEEKKKKEEEINKQQEKDWQLLMQQFQGN